MKSLKIFFLTLFFSLSTFANNEYETSLKLLQGQLITQQKSQGEWAGLNEGDPRWDAFFMVYTHYLYQMGLPFITKKIRDQVVEETIFRFKTFRGFQKNGWSLNADRPISARLTCSLLLALNHIDPKLAQVHFPTQLAYYKKKNWGVGDMSVLDRVLFRMMGAPGHIMIPIVITPTLFAKSKQGWPINNAKLGYYRWGFIAVAVWAHYDQYDQLEIPVAPMSQESILRAGHYILFPEETSRGGSEFWAEEGVSWLLERPHGDGNPAPTLIVQMALAAAHRAKLTDLTAPLTEGWQYMNQLRFKMRSQAKVFQPSISPIWDTARVLSAVRHIPKKFKNPALNNTAPAIQKALSFLLREQDNDGGDYLMANDQFLPGGWGFAYGGKEYPDSDDTAMVIDALIPYAHSNKTIRESLKKGVQWLIQMQNPEGGFPAWDYDATGLIEYLIQNTSLLPNTSLEPQPDISARVLRALKHVSDAHLAEVPSRVFEKGCRYLKHHAKEPQDDLWAGTWAVNYLYGTSEVLSTLITLDCFEDLDLQKYISWVQSIQNPDGGWGESVLSYESKNFIGHTSTLNQTLGALQLLLSYESYRKQNKLKNLTSAMGSIDKGIDFYIHQVMAQKGDINDEAEGQFTACYACPYLYVRYDLIPLYMGTEVLGKYLTLKK